MTDAPTNAPYQERSVLRNGLRFANPTHFDIGPENLHKALRAEEFLAQIYSKPIDLQAIAAAEIVRENEALGPYLFYSATKTGHVRVARAFTESGKVVIKQPCDFESSVRKCEEQRRSELFKLDADEKVAAMEKYLVDFRSPLKASELLFYAAMQGESFLVKVLLDKGVEPYPAGDETLVALHAACHHGRLECAKILVASGVDVNVRDEFGGTPLMRAAVGGQVEVLRWLLDNGATGDVRETRQGNINALEYAAGRSADIVRLLLNSCGFSPAALMAAASFGNEDAFDMLFEAGKFPPIPSVQTHDAFWKEGLSDVHREAIVGSIDHGGAANSATIVTRLVSYVPKGSLHEYDPIMDSLDRSIQRAAIHDSIHSFKVLFPLFAAQGCTDPVHATNTLLNCAAKSNAQQIARCLLDEHGAHINSLDSQHNATPIYSAASHGHADMVNLLLTAYSADIHIGSGKFANGPTPLAIAIQSQHEDVVRILLDHGGAVEYVDPDIQVAQTKRIYASMAPSARYPVRLLADMNPEWDDEGNREKFICLEYPEGWNVMPVYRRSDHELKDHRELRLVEEDNFVVV